MLLLWLACGDSPEDIRRICDAPRACTTCGASDSESQLTELDRFLEPQLRDPALWSALRDASIPERAVRLRRAASDAAIQTCPLADRWQREAAAWIRREVTHVCALPATCPALEPDLDSIRACAGAQASPELLAELEGPADALGERVRRVASEARVHECALLHLFVPPPTEPLTGAIDDVHLHRGLARNRPLIAHCLAGRDGSATGVITIGSSGFVLDAAIAESSYDTETTACLVSRLKRYRFEPPRGGAARREIALQ